MSTTYELYCLDHRRRVWCGQTSCGGPMSIYNGTAQWMQQHVGCRLEFHSEHVEEVGDVATCDYVDDDVEDRAEPLVIYTVRDLRRCDGDDEPVIISTDNFFQARSAANKEVYGFWLMTAWEDGKEVRSLTSFGRWEQS